MCGPNPFLLGGCGELGIPSQQCVAVPGVGLTVREPLSLSYWPNVDTSPFARCVGVTLLDRVILSQESFHIYLCLQRVQGRRGAQEPPDSLARSAPRSSSLSI